MPPDDGPSDPRSLGLYSIRRRHPFNSFNKTKKRGGEVRSSATDKTSARGLGKPASPHVMDALNRMRKAADNAIRERAKKEAERRVAGE